MEDYQVIRLTEVFTRTLIALGEIVARLHITAHVLGERVDEMGSLPRELRHIQGQLATIIEGEGIITAADDRIEADVTAINSATTNIASLLTTLKGEVAAGGAPSSQTLADLDAAVAGLQGLTAPATPATPPAGGDTGGTVTPPDTTTTTPPADGGTDAGATGAGDAPVTSP